MITINQSGSLENSLRYLGKLTNIKRRLALSKYGTAGVNALSSATPVRTGKTASSWGYEVKQTANSDTITFTNSNINNGVSIAVILQYGHGTRNGGYVQGRDYINPAIRPVFDKIADEAWREVVEL